MDVSIIIPCHNEENVLQRKIQNTLTLGKYLKEIIIVDDHSTDKTYAIAKKASKEIKKIKVMQNTCEKGKNTAIRLALNETSGEVVGITDADVLLPSNALQEIKEPITQDGVGMVCLATQLISTGKDTEKKNISFYERIIRMVKIIESKIDSVTVPHAQALFFKKEIDIHANRQADDVDLAIQARKKGYSVKYVKDCFFREEILEDEDDLKKQKVRRCKAVIDALLHHKDVFCNPKYGLFGFMCYPLDLIIFVFSPILFFIFLMSLTLFLFFVNPFIAMLFIIMSAILFSYTRCKSIIHLSVVNILALKECLKEENKENWETKRRENT